MKKILITLGLLFPFIAYTQVITTIAGNGTASYTGNGGPATTATINHPGQVVTDASGNIYFAELDNNVIRKISTSGIISTVAGNGTAGFSGDAGQATAAELNQPYGVAVDPAGNIYIGDAFNNRIRKVNTSGIITTIAGTGTGAYSGDGGLATAAELWIPTYIRLDNSGNLYICDNQNQRVRKINTSGIISLIAGNGTSGYTGDGGPATSAELNFPCGATPDNSGNVYIIDGNDGVIRKVNTSGIISTIAGTGTLGYSGDGGPATAAELNHVQDMFIDGAGNMYFADTYNNRIRQINTSGIINTVAGSGTAGFSGDNGLAILAKLNDPDAVFGNAAGNIFISDEANQRIRMLGPITPITGTATVCAGDTTHLSDVSTGGTWSSSNTSVAQVIEVLGTTATIYGASSGTATISYILDSTTYATMIVTVSIAPNAGTITGTTNVCVGSSITLTDAATGGTWSSEYTSIAIVGSSTGIVTGEGAGRDTISYTVTNACGSATAITVVTVNANPAPILGNPSLCTGSTTSLSDISGGTWSSSNTLVATIGSGTGIVTAVSVGTTTITDRGPSGCYVTIVVTVNAGAAAISSGNPKVCVGLTIPLSDATAGGTWSSGNTGVATVGSSSGVVTGVNSGTSIITYNASGCTSTIIVTVYPIPDPISGITSACVGNTISLTDTVTGGNWASSNSAVATVGSSTGIVTGISPGTVTITNYIGTSACSVSIVITVNATPATILGTLTLCQGLTTSLTDISSGGTWSSGNTIIATVGSSTGVVTGVAAGSANITYAISGCNTVSSVTVNATPSAILGTKTICLGGTTSLTDSVGGGTWSSSNGTVASIGSSGLVNGNNIGTSIITYSLGTGCVVTTIVTVSAGVTAINPSGAVNICLAGTASLSDATGGGTWSSANTTIANVGTSGIVTGIGIGATNISYILPTGCFATKTVTVNNAPVPISPSSAILCSGTTVTLSDTSTGGIWSSSATGTATVSGGVVSGVTTGTVTTSYAIGSCFVTATVTVIASPSAITPVPATVCLGSATNLTDPTTGGIWSSNATSIASVTSGGVVTGNGIGTATISYTAGSCYATTVVTVNNAPGAISPANPAVCIGNNITLTDATAGGAWSSSATSTATVTGGVVTGVASGTATISYGIGSCYATKTVTVNPDPSAINPSGAVSICLSGTASLSDGTGGGTWSSSATVIASVSSAGVVTGTGIGTANISYILSTGCYITKTITVNNAPASISPVNPSVCAGSTITLTDATSGGIWSSGATGTATVSGGVVTGIATGTATISYEIGSCYTTTTLTVDASPAAITPSSVTLCLSGTITLTDATGGGIWSSSATTVASVTSGGLVTANTIGTATISYTAGGCSATTVVTVNTAPNGIFPTNPSVCVGSTTNLTDATSGGIWSSGEPAIATVIGGVVTGVATGTANISYSIGYCSSSVTITVNAAPEAITPTPAVVCLGGTDPLTDGTVGGTWSSSATGIASVSSGGVVTGNAIGTATIAYSISGCSVITVATVNAAPAAISPAGATVCTGGTVTLTDATSGGIWSSSAPAVASVSGGVVTGLTAGTATISYTIGACPATATISVNATPAPIAPVPVTVCLGGTSGLTDATTGGAWSSSASGIASITSGGIVTGNAVGTATIFYTVAGCSASTVATVNTTPGAIAPANPSVCTGSAINLSDATSGGVWSSSATGTATITSFGIVTGLTTGTAIISYAIGACYSTTIISVNPTPSAINPGSLSLCIGNTSTLSDATGSGIWSSSATAVATVSGGGLVTAVASGSATILYTVGGCSATAIVNVNTSPTAISPAAPVVCAGSSTTLFDAVGGGVWSSANTAIAGISTSGTVTGIVTGTTTISYTVGTCFTTTIISVNPTPFAINPDPAEVCLGGTTTLTDATGGGTWSSSASGIASITSGGSVTGVATGTAIIAYTNSLGCSATTIVTVTTLGSAGSIIGPLTICQGSFDIYIDYTAGGTWSLSNGLGAISSVGVVDATTPGADTVIYTITNACGSVSTTKAFNIVPSTTGAGMVTGPSSTCVGSSITLSDAIAPGGDWSSTNGHASVGSGSGIVTGISAGLDTIIYSVTTVCGTYTTSATVNVDATATPAAISGPSTVCVGSDISLTDADGGGTWSASNAHASVTSGTGVVFGITPGSDTVTYTTVNGCGIGSVRKTITVIPATVVGAINGLSSVCQGSTIHLTDASGGGVWSATNGNATINSTGHVTGVTAGVDTMIYTITGICGTTSITKTVTINPLPDAGTILGPDSVCVGSTITLLDFTAGGTWSAGNSNATVSTTGVVTGLFTGTDPISYAITNTCGTTYATKIITVSTIANPGVITGISNVCVGSAITLTDTAAGGIWLSANGRAAIVGPGIVAGVSPGIDSIFYVVINSCGTNEARKVIDVHAVPVVPAISGPTSQCVGTVINLTNSTAGGDWTSSNTTVAIVDVTTGSVVGMSAGIATITYNVTNLFGCSSYVTSPDTVNMLPVVSAITGASNICVGSTTTLNETSTGGIWSSSNTSIATVDASGNVTGTGAGVATISYTVSGICGSLSATWSMSVNPLPVIAAITGIANECVGSTTTLANTTGGGIWTSTNTSIASVDPTTGLATGIAPGVVNIIYSITNGFGCSSSVSIADTVNALPATSAITGITNECVGTMSALADPTSGGTWSSSDNTIATIDPVAGDVLGISGGIVTITYMVTNASGCSDFTTAYDTVNTTPATAPVTGPSAVCQGTSVAFSNAVSGGVWSATNANAAINSATGIATGVTTGTDTIIYTIANSCGSAMSSTPITVNPIPAVASITASYTTVCAGTSVTLSDATTGGIWVSLDTLIASVSSTGIVTGIATGNDTIMYAITNSFGCSGEATYVISIAPAISSITVVPASATICHGTPVNMHTTTTPAGVTYQWLLNGSIIPGATNSDYITDLPGNYTLIVNNGTCSETIAGTIVSLAPHPVISFTAPDILYTGSFNSYQWYKNGVAIPGATGSVLDESGNGLYSVVVTDVNGCSDTSSGYVISGGSGGGGGGTTGISSTPSVSGVRIYPNPATSVLTIEASVKVNATVLTVDGRTAIEQQGATTLDVSRLPNALYIIMIYDENNVLLMTSKFVKADQ